MAAVPNLFGTRDQIRERQFFHRPGWGGGDSFWMMQVHHIYCALYFYLVAISGYSALTLQLGFVPL